jgi:hypothetical protein
MISKEARERAIKLINSAEEQGSTNSFHLYIFNENNNKSQINLGAKIALDGRGLKVDAYPEGLFRKNSSHILLNVVFVKNRKLSWTNCHY